MIAWTSFILVVVVALVAACLVVALFSVGLRLSDGAAPWHRSVSVLAFVLCGVAVAFGIYLIVPALHALT